MADRECPGCRGTGEVTTDLGPGALCPFCQGDGTVADTVENDRLTWAERNYTEPCDSCGAKVGQPCRTASGYVTMRHASRRRTTLIPPAECANPECDHDRTIPSPGCALRRVTPPGVTGA